jgi:phosphoribosylamine--glycine ligase
VNVVVVGAGGREHALAHVLARSVSSVTVTPGNAGIPNSTAVPPEKLDADLFVIGPEAPLVDGLADRLRAQGKVVFGPGADGARLEGSKAWMKELLVDVGVPTARHGTFTDLEPAFAFLDELPGLYVVKTDGLAAGKGVLVTESIGEARDAVRAYLSGEAFGSAGQTVVIEEGLTGPELSILAVCDGSRAVALAPSQDFKRVGDDDAGPNTGGMGAFSPVPAVSTDVFDDVMERAVRPTLAALKSRGIDYRGVLYAGLMLTPDGAKMLEYNVRFGDPEAQVVLPRLRSDLGELLWGAATGALDADAVEFDDGAAVTVVCATEGYPRSTRTGDVIEGLAEASSVDEVTVFCAAVSRSESGNLVTAGGRVLAITGQASTISQARAQAYDAVKRVSWPGMHYRNDIAAAAAKEEQR